MPTFAPSLQECAGSEVRRSGTRRLPIHLYTMAKVYSPLAGNIRGRVGSTVFRKGQRSVVASQYQPDVNNPKTQRQAVNRAAFATAAAGLSGLRDVVNHSFETLKTKRENLQRFMAINKKAILADINAALAAGTGDTAGLINLKGVSGIQPYPYRISEGSLGFVPQQSIVLATIGGHDVNCMALPEIASTAIPGTITTQAQYEQALAALGLLAGDELSIVAIIANQNVVSGSFESSHGTLLNFATHVKRARVTFKAELPDSFTGALIVGSSFNPALIEREEGDLLVTLKASTTEGNVIPCITCAQLWSESLDAGALIRSQVGQDGRYLYSPATMAVSMEADAMAYATESYLATSGAGEGSEYFLDNPAAPSF